MNARFLLGVLALSLAVTGCGGSDSEGANQTAGVVERVKEHTARNQNGGVRIDDSFNNDQLVTVEMKGHKFALRSREASLEKFPCQRCHKVPLSQMKHDGKDGKAKAHWNVALKHADAEVMSCSTCHFEGDMNQLCTLANQPVAINNSYRVCAQCHSKQAADWAGGAHGKRAGGWAPPRVVKTCAECHNPHSPAWDHRYPARVTRREDKPGHE